MAKIFALNEGCFSVDASKQFIPFNADIHHSKDRPASLFIHVQPFLIETQQDLILIDAGLGFNNEMDTLILHNNIRKAGFEPEDVSLVLLSHLHFDHIGGLIFKTNSEGDSRLSFTHADYIIQENEWNVAYTQASKSYNTTILDILHRSGNIRFVNGNGNLTDDISFNITGGHCEWHQVFLIKDGDEQIFFGGDILPEPEQILRRFLAKYDFDPKKAMLMREEYAKKAADEGWTCLFYHAKDKPISKIGFDGNHFNIY